MEDFALYTSTSRQLSALLMRRYSTSFTVGARLLHRRFRTHICAIYGFVRLADEMVDTFHKWDKSTLIKRFREDTEQAIATGLSLNPILHAFQHTVRTQSIGRGLIASFFRSMEMDIYLRQHNSATYKRYIHGSAEAVGLMCLQVFCEGDNTRYKALKPYAISLGAAFQKVNFLRDLKDDYLKRGRIYFPEITSGPFDDTSKKQIEADIAKDFSYARKGIAQLPRGSQLGVYVAYMYFYHLFLRMRKVSVKTLLQRRMRLSNSTKTWLLLSCYARLRLGVT